MGGDIIVIRIKHDWSVSVGTWTFGICEPYPDVWANGYGEHAFTQVRPTSVHVGPTYFRTNLTAFEVLGIGSMGALLLVAVVALVITKVRSGNSA